MEQPGWPSKSAHAVRLALPGIPATHQLGPAACALFDLYLANRVADEDYARCFTRLGAPRYASMLRHALEQTASVSLGE